VTIPQPPLAKAVIAEPKTGTMTALQLNQQQQLWDWTTRGHATVPTTVGGTADAITLTPNLNNKSIPQYINGMAFSFVATSTNTGPVTLNVSKIGAKAVLDSQGNAIVAGQLTAGALYVAYYSSQNDSFYIPSLSSAGSWVFLQSETVSGSPTALVLDNMSSASYDDYAVVFDNIVPNTRASLVLQISFDGGASFVTSGYIPTSQGVLLTNAASSAPNADLGGGASGIAYVPNVRSTSQIKFVHGTCCFFDGTTSPFVFFNVLGGGYNGAFNAVNAVRITPALGTLALGTAKLYGLKNA